MREQTGAHRFSLAGIFEARSFALFSALLLAIAYYKILLGGETLCYRDFGVMGIPTAFYHRAAFWAGEFPLWNPYSNCGAPFLAQWGTMVLYPPSLIYVLLPMPWSLNLFCVLHLWLGGLGIYCLARRWKLEAWPAAFAGISFAFCGITQSTLSWPNYTAALGLLPWVILTVERAWDSAGWRNQQTFFAVVVSSLQLLTGVPELAVFTWGTVTVLWVVRLLTAASRRRHFIRTQILVVAGTAGVCAAQLLPFLQLLQHSQRTPGFTAEKWALPAWGWANLVLPRFHTFTTPEGTVFQYGQEFLSSTYLGAALVLLAILAWRQRGSRVAVLVLLTIAAAILALGSNSLIYAAALKILPFLKIARYPVKFLYILSFTVPLLAAFGLQSMTPSVRFIQPRAIIRMAIGIFVVLGVLVFWNHAYPFRYDRVAEIQNNSMVRLLLFGLIVAALLIADRVPARFLQPLRLLILGLMCLDGATHLPRQNPTVATAVFEPGLWAQSQNVPKPEHGLGRAFITPTGEAKLLHSNVPDVRDDLIGKRLALWSHLNLLDLVPKVNGSATLQLRGQAAVQNALYNSTNEMVEPWLDFLNVTITTSTNSAIEWQTRANPMPFITAGQRPVRANTNLLEHPIPFGKQVAIDPWSADLEQLTNAVVEISDVAIRPGEVSFSAAADKATVAVLPVSWHPAWAAEVSSEQGLRAVPVWKANVAFQAVPIPAGRSHVRLFYRDNLFRVGSLVSAVTLLGFGSFCLGKQKRSSQV